MRWTKVRKLVHDSFADSVRGRVRVDITNAHPRGEAWADRCLKGWISVDGRTVVYADDDWVRLSLPIRNETQESQVVFIAGQYSRVGVAGGEAWRYMDIPSACWQYLHSSLNDSLSSLEPFVSALAVLNAKVGRRRLNRAMDWDLHPLTRAMLDFRLQAEAAARTAA